MGWSKSLSLIVAVLVVCSGCFQSSSTRSAKSPGQSETTITPKKDTRFLQKLPGEVDSFELSIPEATLSEEDYKKRLGPLKYLRYLQTPKAPTEDEARLDVLLKATKTQLAKLSPFYLQFKSSENEFCEKFGELSQGLHEDILERLDESRDYMKELGLSKFRTYEDEKALLLRGRLESFSALFSFFSQLLQSDMDGGTLDRRLSKTGKACAVEDREELKIIFSNSATLVRGVLQEYFGHEPILVDGFLANLNTANIEELEWEDTKDNFYLAGAIGASLVLWKFAPLVATGWTTGAKVWGAVALLSAEVAANVTFHKYVVLPQSEWLDEIGSQQTLSAINEEELNQFLEETEEIVDESLDAPVVYANYLFQRHKNSLLQAQQVLIKHGQTLDADLLRFGDVDKAILYYESFQKNAEGNYELSSQKKEAK